jgi:hypothetical protein
MVTVLKKIQEDVPPDFGYIFITGQRDQLTGVDQTELNFLSNLSPDVAVEVMDGCIQTLEQPPQGEA